MKGARATYVRPTDETADRAILACVGEQPGNMEVIRSRVFIGDAGDELNNDLHSAKIRRLECYLTNVIKDLDKPLFKYITYNSKSGVHVTAEAQQYINELGEELSNLKTDTIVAFGNVALHALTDRWGITAWRGSVLKSTLVPGKTVIPTFHPATVIPPKNQFLNRRLIINDLIRAKKITDGIFEFVDRTTKIKPSFEEAVNFLQELFIAGLNGSVIDYDIEVSNQEVACIAFAKSRYYAMCIPFVHQHGSYFSPEQEVEIWERIALILESPIIAKRAQNACFDFHFLLAKYGIRSHNTHDTMIAQRILMPDYNKGLHFITSIYTDIPYYKEDGKFWLKSIGSWEQGWVYNCTDALATADAGPQQMWDLEIQDNIETYYRTKKIVSPLVYMMERGIKIDVKGMTEAYHNAAGEIEKELTVLHDMCGRSLNPNSFPQMTEYFYKFLGIKPYKKKGKSKSGVTLNEEALIRIARRGFKQAKQVLKIRGLVKNRSTYLNPAKVDDDGRMRCSYDPVGTKFSRLSSSKNIFGRGNNLQNQPHKILKYFLADDGYIYYSIDLSQAENRIVAYVGRVTEMIDAFESGKDVHSLTASFLFGIPYDEVSDEPGSCGLGDGSKSQRFYGKKSNHELNYDIGFKRFSLILQIPELEGRALLEKYHRIYPGVRQVFQHYVKRCILHSRTIENLFERKTYFAGNMNTAQGRNEVFKSAYSCIPQGSVGDLINERGLNHIYYDNDELLPIELLNQVHDSIGFQMPLPRKYQTNGVKPLEWVDHARALISIKRSLGRPLKTHYGREFSIPCDLTMGLNMYKEEGLEVKNKDWIEDAKQLANKLEINYEKLCVQQRSNRQSDAGLEPSA